MEMSPTIAAAVSLLTVTMFSEVTRIKPRDLRDNRGFFGYREVPQCDVSECVV